MCHQTSTNLAKGVFRPIIGAIALSFLVVLANSTQAKSEIKGTPVGSPYNEQDAIKASELSQQAQAEYYKAATAKLREKSKSWYPVGSLATLLTVLGTLGAASWTIFPY